MGVLEPTPTTLGLARTNPSPHSSPKVTVLVRYLVSEAGTLTDRQVGDILDLPDREAKLAIRAGKAEAVKQPAEAATRTASQNASMPRARGREV